MSNFDFEKWMDSQDPILYHDQRSAARKFRPLVEAALQESLDGDCACPIIRTAANEDVVCNKCKALRDLGVME